MSAAPTAERRRRAQAELTAGMVNLSPAPSGVRAARKADQLTIQAVRDAEILAGGEIVGRFLHFAKIKVQSTALSHSLIWRAGVRHQKRFDYYVVVASQDHLKRWQLAEHQESGVEA